MTDGRTDTFRQEYTPLSDMQKTQMRKIKVKAAELEALIKGSAFVVGSKTDMRCISLAQTNLEQAIMWAVKGITS